MKQWSIKTKLNKNVLALGPESDGNFSFYDGDVIYFSTGYGDLIEEKNFQTFRKDIDQFIKNKKTDIILTDLHPAYRTTLWGEELAAGLGAHHFKIQHHFAHIFSVLAERAIKNQKVPESFFGIASDGTGYGLDETIWGGEIFEIFLGKKGITAKRVGSLERQLLIGGDKAILEPARMVISILSKFLKKEDVYSYVSKFYNPNHFELLFNQMSQRFNCQETSSTGRVLDATSILLGFASNEREYKHQPVTLLEKNSAQPYELEPVIEKQQGILILKTTPLFEYLIANLKKDKKRLAATAQAYIANGFYDICLQSGDREIFFSGGMANNKIMANLLSEKGVNLSQEIPRGDAGLSLGQLMYYLLANSRD